jgi:predicted DNA-binding protein with PD1-like motif
MKLPRACPRAHDHHLRASQFTAIGAFSSALVGYFDWEKKVYQKIRIDDQVEVLSLIGDVSLDQGEARVHAHVVLGKSDGTAHGGHLLSGHVRPTLEVVLTESPAYLRRRYDPESGLALIDPMR